MKSIDPVLAACFLLLLLVIAGAGAAVYVTGLDPEKLNKPAAAVGGVTVLTPIEETEFKAPPSVRAYDIQQRYAAVFEKNFFLAAAASTSETSAVVAGAGNGIDVGRFRLVGILMVEGGEPRAFLDDGTGLATRVEGDSMPSAGGPPVVIVEIRRDGVLLSQEGFENTLLPLATSLESLGEGRSWIGDGEGEGALLRIVP